MSRYNLWGSGMLDTEGGTGIAANFEDAINRFNKATHQSVKYEGTGWMQIGFELKNAKGQYGTKDGVSGFMYTTYIGNGSGDVVVGKKNNDADENADDSSSLKQQDDSWTHLIGPTLIGLGQPIKALKPIGMLGSKPGSSIASYTLRKIVPSTLKGVFGRKVGGTLVELAGTNGLGAALGRFVPIVGIAWTLGDIQSWGFYKSLEMAPNDEVRDEMLNGYTFGL